MKISSQLSSEVVGENGMITKPVFCGVIASPYYIRMTLMATPNPSSLRRRRASALRLRGQLYDFCGCRTNQDRRRTDTKGKRVGVTLSDTVALGSLPSVLVSFWFPFSFGVCFRLFTRTCGTRDEITTVGDSRRFSNLFRGYFVPHLPFHLPFVAGH